MFHNFAPACVRETIVFGASRPGYYNAGRVGPLRIEEWISFMTGRGIRRVCCLQPRDQLSLYPTDLLEHYRRRFGAGKVCHAPIPDFAFCTGDQLQDVILPFLQDARDATEPVVVHCSAESGRTAHVLAAWLVAGRKVPVAGAQQLVEAAGAFRNCCEAGSKEALVEVLEWARTFSQRPGPSSEGMCMPRGEN